MDMLTTIRDMQAWSDARRAEGKRIGLVPTMGALHEGHLSLVERASRTCDVVVASVFVNPTQFAPNEDFARYPRQLEDDRRLLETRGTTALFVPATGEMYPPEFLTKVEVGGLAEVLEGRTRPTHFGGVTLVVAKLFLAVKPHVAVFGRKDAQQALVIRRMVRDLNFDIEIDVAPTVREPDGLAMSSRNRYLSSEERSAALALSRALRVGYDAWRDGERKAAVLVEVMRRVLDEEPMVRLDYLSVASMETLRPRDDVGPGTLVAAAAWVGPTRLIDNWWITPDGRAEF